MESSIQQYKQAVSVIKNAILCSQYRAAKLVTGEQLSLYFGIGGYVSAHSRQEAWGTSVIDRISEQLRRELPGLRGFSSQNIRNMRSFYEYWRQYIICSPMASKLQIAVNKDVIDIDNFSMQKWSPMASEINREEFLGISFSHHMEILHKTKDLHEYHLEIFGEELFPDLLFLNRELNCMVVVELKKGAFKPGYIGQLQTYMKVLDDKVRKPHENPTIGILLCKSANKAFVEYVIRDYNHPMGVATYKTAEDMSEELRKALPDMDEMRKLLTDDENV